MHKVFFDNVAVLGVGLIGASCALALKEKGLCRSVVGYGRTEEHLRRAQERSIIDGYRLESGEACSDADLVLLATPVGLFTGLLDQIRGSLKKGALVTDVGSVKGCLVQELETAMPEGVQYIGSHPIAGGDKSGIDAARPDLFSNALCIVTPTARSDRQALERIVALWQQLGATVELLDAEMHDEIYAAVSHLPHLVAYALVNAVGDLNPGYLEYTGQGFRDTTRIALSSPEMWRDIALLNRDNIVKLIRLFRNNLDTLERLIAGADGAGIEREFLKAQSLRRTLE